MKTIHLLSKSPRRIELLTRAGIQVRQARSAGEEPLPRMDESPEKYAVRATRAKFQPANPVDGALYLAADTVVAVDGRILGKPADRIEARTMLQCLDGREHTVLTAVVAGSIENADCWVASSTVRFDNLTEDAYAQILADNPVSYAGAYAIQGAAGQFATVTNGRTSTVIGLPVEEVVTWLQKQ